MGTTVRKTLNQLRNKRDLRAEILSLAAELAAFDGATGRLTVSAPLISEATVRNEWDRLLPAIAPNIRGRMALELKKSGSDPGHAPTYRIDRGYVLLDRPNYRFEVLRLLLGAHFEQDGPQHVKGLVDMIGASQTPVRAALAELKKADLLRTWHRQVDVDPSAMSGEILAKIGAMPQTLRFRFERGAQLKSPAALLERATPLLEAKCPAGWSNFALSGTPVALADVPKLDLMGMPRLDFVLRLPRDAKVFDTRLLRQLDDGLELEPNVLAPSPVAVTVVRADTEFVRDAGLGHVRCAYPMDVFFSLLDIGLRDQAMHYAKTMSDESAAH